jgi:acyl-CoA thioesterase-1
VVLELGANDGLRGLPVEEMRTNLAKMVSLSKATGARVLLVGIRIPPNYGQRYGEQFAGSYAALAAQNNLALVPFLLQDVALNPKLMQEDGMHPNAAGEPVVLENVWPHLKPLLNKNR